MKTSGKKLLSLVMALIVTATLFPLTANAEPAAGACPRSPTDQHVWERDESHPDNVPADCVSPGVSVWVCHYCHEPVNESVPALGHNWGDWQTGNDNFGTYHQPPTCTEDGVEFRVCSRCEQVETRVAAALGHSWDAGTVTRAARCTEAGELTYRCTRDGCTATRTESIPALGHDWNANGSCRRCGASQGGTAPVTPPAPETAPAPDTPRIEPASVSPLSAAALFASLRNLPQDGNDLVITQQPEGGAVTRDAGEGVTISVEVAGGTEPYTYEWYCRDLEEEAQNNSLIVWASDANWALSTTFHNAASGWYSGHAQTYADAFSHEWLSAVTGDGSFSDFFESLDLLRHDMGATEEPFITVSKGNCEYWVVITDNAGHTVTSDRAHVRYRVRIAEQPRNVNWQSESGPEGVVRLECQAADGSDDYYYEWFQNDEWGLPYALYTPAEIMDTGTYVCRVTDRINGDTVLSDTVEVYDALPLRVYSIPSGTELWEEEEWEVTAVIDQGVPPYEVWWDVNGVPLATEQGEDDSEGRPTFHAVGVGSGKYTVHVTDSMGESVSASTYREDRMLHFSQQPEDAVLSEDGVAELSVTVDDGTPPYTFILYRNGRRVRTRRSTESSSWTFSEIEATGDYYVRVRDADGHTGRSDHATVSLPEFRITSQTLAVDFYGEPVYPGVVVEGGQPPYTYQWMVNYGNGWYTTGSDSSMVRVVAVGRYTCRITDSEGRKIYSQEIPVTYKGETPWITFEPEGGTIPSGGSFTLQCQAVSGSGDHTLRYDWQRRPFDSNKDWVLWEWSRQTLETSRPGLYRCRVTDLDTGAVSYSRSVSVYRDLRFVSAEMYAQIAPGTGLYHVNIEGGLPNYTIYVYYYNEAKDEWILYRTTLAGSELIALRLPLWRPVGGGNERVVYYFEIIDRNGQTCSSPYVTW